MTKRLQKYGATFEQVLIYAEGPQLVLLSGPANSKILAVAIPSYNSFEYPFFAAQISADQFLDYLNERCDLRYVLLKPDMRRHFFFDLGSCVEDEVQLHKVSIRFSEIEKYVPDPGLFAREHTEKLSVTLPVPKDEEVFGVDGSWDLPEFSQFYNNVTDIYSLFDSLEVYSDKNTDALQKSQIEMAFVKPFEGGGSYVSLYDSLATTQPMENRLRVSGITYNSPGVVKLKGYAKPFREVRALITNFEENFTTLQSAYKDLHSTLSQNKLLKTPSSKFREVSPIKDVMNGKAKVLSKLLDIDYATLNKMCGRNSLVTSKVLLSMFRRGLRMYEFFLEGRASFDRATSLSQHN